MDLSIYHFFGIDLHSAAYMASHSHFDIRLIEANAALAFFEGSQHFVGIITKTGHYAHACNYNAFHLLSIPVLVRGLKLVIGRKQTNFEGFSGVNHFVIDGDSSIRNSDY